VRFSVEQSFAAPLADVGAALCDPGFLARLGQLPKLGGARLLEQRREGGLVVQRVRYAFVGELSPAVRAVVEPDRLTWVEESTTDLAMHRTEWRIVPDHYGNLLRCSGTFRLEARGPSSTRRIAEGDVQVRVPFVGGKVERAIVSGLRDHARLEEEALASWLDSSD
jgi:hypothetical protein